MNLLLDTNRYRDYVQGESAVLARLRDCEQVALSFVSLAELEAGFRLGSRSDENRRALEQFLAKPVVRVLFADRQTCEHYAEVYTRLRAKGRPIPTNDIWIAALAIQHQCPLFTRDHHFDHVDHLPRIG